MKRKKLKKLYEDRLHDYPHETQRWCVSVESKPGAKASTIIASFKGVGPHQATRLQFGIGVYDSIPKSQPIVVALERVHNHGLPKTVHKRYPLNLDTDMPRVAQLSVFTDWIEPPALRKYVSPLYQVMFNSQSGIDVPWQPYDCLSLDGTAIVLRSDLHQKSKLLVFVEWEQFMPALAA